VRSRWGVSRDLLVVDGGVLRPSVRTRALMDSMRGLERRLLTVGTARSHCDAVGVGGDAGLTREAPGVRRLVPSGRNRPTRRCSRRGGGRCGVGTGSTRPCRPAAERRRSADRSC
jgi:hypothetical protein